MLCLYEKREDSSMCNKGFPIRGDGAKEILITFKTRPGGRCQFNYSAGHAAPSLASQRIYFFHWHKGRLKKFVMRIRR